MRCLFGCIMIIFRGYYLLTLSFMLLFLNKIIIITIVFITMMVVVDYDSCCLYILSK